MKLFKNKWIMVFLILIIGLVSFLGICLLQDNDIVPVDLAVVAKQPVILYDGIVYQHEENGWKALDYTEEIKQIFSDEEYLCVLDVIGKLHCDKLPDPYDFGMSGAIYDMAEQALSINEEQKFITANGHVLSDFKALLSDGSTIIYENIDKFENIVMDEKVAMLSGNYILTVSGNVYSLSLNDATVPFVPELELVYDGGDIAYIDAAETAPRCIGLTKDGKAMIWSEIASPDISDWDDLVKVVHGFNYAAGLTSKGKVLFIHYDEAKSAELEDSFKEWKDIIGIEAYFRSVYGVDKEGKVFVIDFS